MNSDRSPLTGPLFFRTPVRRMLMAVIVPVVVAAVLVALASLVRPQQPTARVVTPTPLVQSRSCAFAGAPGTLVATGSGVQTTTLAGAGVADPTVPGAVTGSILLRQDGADPLAAGVRSQSSAGLMWAECRPPATTGAVIIADPSTAELVLVNPDRTDAAVNISLSGATGDIQSPGLRGIIVPAASMVRVPVSVHAPAGVPITATYRTSQGRVQAAVRSLALTPEQVVASAPLTEAVFATLPENPDQVRLLLHNPGTVRAEVTIEMLGPRGRFAPANGAVSLGPNTTLTVDLSAAFAEESMGLVVTSATEVLSMVTTTGANDIAWVLPHAPETELLDAVPGGVLQMVNPSANEASVTLTLNAAEGSGPTTETITIPAGASAQRPVVAGEVRIVSTTPVAAGVRLSGGGQAVSRVRERVVNLAVAPGVLDPQIGQ